jgi:ATP adenylyltransferase
MDFLDAKKPAGCIFCLFPAETGLAADRRNLILTRTATSFAILNRYPYNNGHLMVIPRRHTADLTSLSDEELDDLHRLLRRSVQVLGEAYHPEGFNIGMNLGLAAGAGIADHLHYHVVPRWAGDTNFMPVVGATKVMVEHLDQSWEKLQPRF